MGRLQVIVAEDDPHMRGWVGRVLTGKDISVREVASGAELLLLLTCRPRVDLVISDVCMPLLDGLEALAMVRMVGMDVPFLLITAFGHRDLRRSVEKLDASVLDKPFSAQELLARVATIVSGLETGPAGRSDSP